MLQGVEQRERLYHVMSTVYPIDFYDDAPMYGFFLNVIFDSDDVCLSIVTMKKNSWSFVCLILV